MFYQQGNDKITLWYNGGIVCHKDMQLHSKHMGQCCVKQMQKRHWASCIHMNGFPLGIINQDTRAIETYRRVKGEDNDCEHCIANGNQAVCTIVQPIK